MQVPQQGQEQRAQPAEPRAAQDRAGSPAGTRRRPGAAGGSWAPGSDRLLMAAARVASSCDIHRWGGGENSFHLLLWSRD